MFYTVAPVSNYQIVPVIKKNAELECSPFPCPTCGSAMIVTIFQNQGYGIQIKMICHPCNRNYGPRGYSRYLEIDKPDLFQIYKEKIMALTRIEDYLRSLD